MSEQTRKKDLPDPQTTKKRGRGMIATPNNHILHSNEEIRRRIHSACRGHYGVILLSVLISAAVSAAQLAVSRAIDSSILSGIAGRILSILLYPLSIAGLSRAFLKVWRCEDVKAADIFYFCRSFKDIVKAWLFAAPIEAVLWAGSTAVSYLTKGLDAIEDASRIPLVLLLIIPFALLFGCSAYYYLILRATGLVRFLYVEGRELSPLKAVRTSFSVMRNNVLRLIGMYISVMWQPLLIIYASFLPLMSMLRSGDKDDVSLATGIIYAVILVAVLAFMPRIMLAQAGFYERVTAEAEE